MNKRTYSQILDDVARDQTPADLNLAPLIMTRIRKGNIQIMQPRLKVLTAVALALLAFVILFFTVPEVAAAIQRWFGYVPGVGLVHEGQIRVLAEPVSLTREGVTVTVEQALVDSERTVIVYRVDDVPPEMLAANPEYPTCRDVPHIRLPGGQLSGASERSQSSAGYPYRSVYPAIPSDVQQVTFVVPCILFTQAGKLPENWELTLLFEPAPPDMTSFPVIEIATPAVPAATVTVQNAPTPKSESITLTLDRAVQMDDGYLIYATLHWPGAGLTGVDVIEPENTIHLLDAGGQEMLYESIDDDNTGMQNEQRQTVFALKTAPIQAAGPLTIVVDTVSADLAELPAPANFTFDPGMDPQPGQTWQLDQDVRVGDYSVRVLTATASENGYSFEMVSESGILFAALFDAEHPVLGGGGGGGGLSGMFSSGFNYADGLPSGPVTVTIGPVTVRRDGPWRAQWTPPDVSTADFPTHPPACLNASTWRQALLQNPPLPEELGGTVLLNSPLSDGSGGWTYSLVGLDGTEKQPLPGIRDGAFSPDGALLAYSADAITILDLASGQKKPIPGTTDLDFTPVWSPDGSQIIFMRGSNYELYIVNLDGSGLRRLTNGGLQEWPIDWLPDGRHIVYSMPGSGEGHDTYLLDIQSGESQPYSGENIGSISPDGTRVITTEDVFGDRWLMYVSALDGSNRKLVADSDIWALIPLWSPDGQWLMLSVSATDSLSTVAAMLRLEDCTIIPLPYLNGEVISWAP